MYAFSENYLLPISHDEVVHGKGSLLTKIPGSRDDQLATLRAFLAYMWSHPGKQLLFMGCEFAQPGEWADGRSLDWWLLDHAAHYRVHALVKELNRVYREHPAMWALDSQPPASAGSTPTTTPATCCRTCASRSADQQGDVGRRRQLQRRRQGVGARRACREPVAGRSCSTRAASTRRARRARPGPVLEAEASPLARPAVLGDGPAGRRARHALAPRRGRAGGGRRA